MKLIFYTLLILVLLFSVNGILGNGAIPEIKESINRKDSSFESSQTRARFALIKALVDDNTLFIDKYSEVGFPDLAYYNGHYYPTFLPGASILAIPFYVIGKSLGLGVLFSNLLVPIALILSSILMYKLLIKLKISYFISLLCTFLMIFGSGLYSYSTSLNAHPISALSITIALYSLVLVLNNEWQKGYPLFWLAFGLTVFLDYPNIITFIPMVILLFFWSKKLGKTGYYLISAVSALIFFIPLLWYTKAAFGTFFTTVTSHELQGYIKDGLPIFEAAGDPGFYKNYQVFYRNLEINPVYLPSGLFNLLISPARGIAVFSPIALLSLWGIKSFLRKYRKLAMAILFAIGATILTYGSYNYNHAGWAYGPRYLIAITPLIIVILAFAIKQYWKNNYFRWLFLLASIVSILISTLGALTSRNLPSPIDLSPSGTPYGWSFDNTFFRQFELLTNAHPSSFLYNLLLSDKLTVLGFYLAIFCVLLTFYLYLYKNVRYDDYI